MTGALDQTALARLHATCFTMPRPWTAAEFSEVLQSAGVFLAGDADAFAIGRAIAGEAELLTLAVNPKMRRQGLGRTLLAFYETAARDRGAQRSFLEVAANNAPAIKLYETHGYTQCGLRRAYYRASDGTHTDALIYEKRLD